MRARPVLVVAAARPGLSARQVLLGIRDRSPEDPAVNLQLARQRTSSLSPGKRNFIDLTPRGPAYPMKTVPTGFSSLPPVGPAMPVVAMP